MLLAGNALLDPSLRSGCQTCLTEFIRDGFDTPKLASAGFVVGAALCRDGLSESRRKAAPTVSDLLIPPGGLGNWVEVES